MQIWEVGVVRIIFTIANAAICDLRFGALRYGGVEAGVSEAMAGLSALSLP